MYAEAVLCGEMIRRISEDHVHFCFQFGDYLDAFVQKEGEVVSAEVLYYVTESVDHILPIISQTL